MNLAYQQLVKYNLAAACEMLKLVYNRQASLAADVARRRVRGTYRTMWACPRALGYWHEVVWSGE